MKGVFFFFFGKKKGVLPLMDYRYLWVKDTWTLGKHDFVVCERMKCNWVVDNNILLVEFLKNGWSGIHSIQFQLIP